MSPSSGEVSYTLSCWFYHTFSLGSLLPFHSTMPPVVPEGFTINFKLLLYDNCTCHWKLWYWAIVWILFYFLFMLLFVFLYFFITFWGINVAAVGVLFSVRLVMSELWLVQSPAHSQAHTKAAQTSIGVCALISPPSAGTPTAGSKVEIRGIAF